MGYLSASFKIKPGRNSNMSSRPSPESNGPVPRLLQIQVIHPNLKSWVGMQWLPQLTNLCFWNKHCFFTLKDNWLVCIPFVVLILLACVKVRIMTQILIMGISLPKSWTYLPRPSMLECALPFPSSSPLLPAPLGYHWEESSALGN